MAVMHLLSKHCRPLYFITAYFTSDFPQYFLGKGKVPYQLIFASFILQRPSEEEAFINIFGRKERKKEGRMSYLEECD